MDWLGQVEYMKTVYEEHQNTICSLAGYYKEHRIKMMILKGYGLSKNYPTPEYRPCGDIDIFLYGKQKEADCLIAKTGVEIHNDNPHHSTFTYNGITVENHHTLMDQDNHKSNVRLENLFHAIIAENCGTEKGDNIYTPSPILNAIYLVRHAGEHFATSEITMRHVLDLGTFFVANHQKVDWNRVLQVYKNESMIRFYDAIATICVRNLGMNEACFRGYTSNEILADRVLADIFSKKESLPMSIAGINGVAKLKYGVQKTIRWWKNRWKYKMVYKETMLESFMVLAFNRLRN